MSESTIRVLCVDDHAVVREGIASIIDMQPDMTVVAAAATGEEAVELFRQHRPDVTLMDLQMPGMGGLEAIRSIRSADTSARIVVLTIYHGDEDMYRALQAGAVTYLWKETVADNLVQVVRDVHRGKRPISSDVAAGLAERISHPALTVRELDVTQLLAKGLRNKEIAAALGIAEDTVQTHVKSILSKLNVNDRTGAVTAALRRGIIHLG